jgi:hypothetical protein
MNFSKLVGYLARSTLPPLPKCPLSRASTMKKVFDRPMSSGSIVVSTPVFNFLLLTKISDQHGDSQVVGQLLKVGLATRPVFD